MLDLSLPQIQAALIAGIVSLVVALLTVVGTERKLRRDFRLEFAAEAVARRLLNDREWRLRSFEIIKHHLAGFSDDELRKVLVRAGAIHFESASGKELWGLLERNRHRLGVERISDEPGLRVIAPK
jgi:hypothetical protein